MYASTLNEIKFIILNILISFTSAPTHMYYTNKHIHQHTHTHTPTYTNTFPHALTHICIHTPMIHFHPPNTHTHTHTHTHTLGQKDTHTETAFCSFNDLKCVLVPE